jgi:protein-L-isoaspartate(D-aspartate) O-methyltransferase
MFSDSNQSVDEFLRESKSNLIESLKAEGILRSKTIEDALLNVPREEFLPVGTPKSMAYLDEPLGLADTGQTISAPHMVVMMLEEAKLSSGLSVLEIGTGSGYNAALTAYIVSRGVTKDHTELVITIERNEELFRFATKNIERVGLAPFCKVVLGDGSLGYPQESEEELYDRIIVTAAAPKVPVFLKKQLKIGGIMEVPVGSGTFQKLTILKKNEKRGFEQRKSVDCVFVPLIGSDAHQV